MSLINFRWREFILLDMKLFSLIGNYILWQKIILFNRASFLLTGKSFCRELLLGKELIFCDSKSFPLPENHFIDREHFLFTGNICLSQEIIYFDWKNLLFEKNSYPFRGNHFFCLTRNFSFHMKCFPLIWKWFWSIQNHMLLISKTKTFTYSLITKCPDWLFLSDWNK